MKIYTLTSIAGIGLSCPPGVVVDYPDKAEAQRMIDGGNARKPTDAELLGAAEKEKARAASAKTAAELAEKTAEIVAKANKKRAADAKKASAKKRENPPAEKKTKKSK